MTTAPKRILIVEDEEVLAKALGRILREHNAELVTAGSIKEAKTILTAGPVDIIILDRMLPDGDGVELLLRLKKESTLKNIPVLILSAKAEDLDKVAGLDLGADDYMAKPFSVVELRARVKTLLRRAHKFAS